MTSTSKIQTRIVVGCDLLETGDHALRQAVQLAKGLEGREELHITHVISSSRNLSELQDEFQAKLAQLHEHTTALCSPPAGEPPFDIECVLHVRVGRPAAQLHQVAVDVGADLIVVGTHGRPRVQELVLGSVAQELMRMAQVSVLVAHPNTLSGLPKSPRTEPPRAGEDLHKHGASNRVRLQFAPRSQHISGLL